MSELSTPTYLPATKLRGLFATKEEKDLVESTLRAALGTELAATVNNPVVDNVALLPVSPAAGDTPSFATNTIPAANNGEPLVLHDAFHNFIATGGTPEAEEYISSSHNAAGSVLPANQTFTDAQIDTLEGAKVEVHVHSMNGVPGQVGAAGNAQGGSPTIMTTANGQTLIDQSFSGARFTNRKTLIIKHGVGNGI